MVLARSRRGVMTAPAGCGKTEVIAAAVAHHGGKRELVLTHTHAGVEALRRRLQRFGISARRYRLDTIASWTLRLCRAFPASSGLGTEPPRIEDEYRAAYNGAAQIVRSRPIREIISASYSGVFVDEYQDCTIEQHELITAIADVLPCRVVGDPLQGIFGFGGNAVVDWGRDVESAFHPVPGPVTPWRWANTNGELGEWLREIRETLEAGQSLDLRDAPIEWVPASTREPAILTRICMERANLKDGTVAALRQWPKQCQNLAQKLKGRYSCLEPLEALDLFRACDDIDGSEGLARALVVLDFASCCMTQVSSKLQRIRSAFAKGRIPRVRKNVEQLRALECVAQSGDPRSILAALHVLAGTEGAVVYRRELLSEMKRALLVYADEESSTLEEAARIVRNRTRRHGRLLPRCTVGTTLLVKGLEFDHVIVSDAHDYDRRNLYVALTRATRSLTVVSPQPILSPRERNP